MDKRVSVIAALVLVGVMTPAAAAQQQEREPIRIRNKTLLFELTGKTWKRDRIGEQWKPLPADQEDTSRFEVTTVEPKQGCAPFSARELKLDVRVDGASRMFRIYPRRNYDPTSGAFWKNEPKLDSPIDMEAAEQGKRLRFKVHKEVYIAAIYADGEKKCEFAASTPRIELLATPAVDPTRRAGQ